MKHKLLCTAAALALIAASATVFAPAAFAQAVAPDVLPPHEIVTIVRSAGLNPLERPVRRGNTYVFRAIGARGQEMRVTVDARYGDVMSVAPVANVAVPPRLPGPGMTMGPYERVDRDRDDDIGSMTLSPPGIYGSRPPPIGGAVDDDDDAVVYAPGARPPNMQAMPPGTVRPPSPVTAAPLAPPPGGPSPYGAQPRMQSSAPLPPPSSAPAPTYLPPPAASAAPAPSTSTAAVGETQQLGEGGLLPPPPERFPQRALPPAASAKPAPKPKPAAAQPKPGQQQKTASSGTQPAKPPLPKSKPAAPANASTVAPAPATAAPPAKKPADDEVPH
jgi:hypothetical protein